MNIQSIVEQVTREIVQGGSVSLGKSHWLVIYTEESKAFWDVLEQLQGSQVSVLLPRYLQEVFPMDRLAESGYKVHFDHEPIASDLPTLADNVVVASLPRSLELQLASEGRGRGTVAFIKAAMLRKPVYLAYADGDSKKLQQMGFVLGLPGGSSCEGKPCQSCGKCVSRCPQRVQTLVDAGASRISGTPGTANTRLARMIDHTLLKPDAIESEVAKLCDEAARNLFASVCINPSNVAQAASLLRGSPVKVCTVIGFPLGATTPEVKAFEAKNAIQNGANEIDMVINVGALKSQNYRLVEDDIRAVANACKGHAILKVILETCLLTDEEKVAGCALSKQAGADYVKTSTGFSKGGATAADIALMRKTVGPEMGVKASGGVRDYPTALAMVEAGATRIGASASVEIVQGKAGTGSY